MALLRAAASVLCRIGWAVTYAARDLIRSSAPGKELLIRRSIL